MNFGILEDKNNIIVNKRIGRAVKITQCPQNTERSPQVLGKDNCLAAGCFVKLHFNYQIGKKPEKEKEVFVICGACAVMLRRGGSKLKQVRKVA